MWGHCAHKQSKNNDMPTPAIIQINGKGKRNRNLNYSEL